MVWPVGGTQSRVSVPLAVIVWTMVHLPRVTVFVPVPERFHTTSTSPVAGVFDVQALVTVMSLSATKFAELVGFSASAWVVWSATVVPAESAVAFEIELDAESLLLLLPHDASETVSAINDK